VSEANLTLTDAIQIAMEAALYKQAALVRLSIAS
jgi:hypothetical protein